jgi:predicted acetyltransferase
MPNLTIDPANRQQKSTIRNLMQFYLHDLSVYADEVLDSDGLFHLDQYFDAYWSEAERHPFLIWVDDTLAGFAFVREIEPGIFSMAEFFVVRGFRGTGVAAKAAAELFDRFRGEWRVAQMERNVPAQRFWRRVIGEYTRENFVEQWTDADPSGPLQVFNNQADS